MFPPSKEYCQSFEHPFYPLICLLRNVTGYKEQLKPLLTKHFHKPTHGWRPKLKPWIRPRPPRPPPPGHLHHHHHYHHEDHGHHHEEWEDDDDNDCCCDLTCVPLALNQTMTNYTCTTCGAKCEVVNSSVMSPTCTCTVLNGAASNSTCDCVVTCAQFRFENVFASYHHHSDHDDDDDDDWEDESTCIFNVMQLEENQNSTALQRRPYNCECKKSLAAQDNSIPQFICICQNLAIVR